MRLSEQKRELETLSQQLDGKCHWVTRRSLQRDALQRLESGDDAEVVLRDFKVAVMMAADTEARA